MSVDVQVETFLPLSRRIFLSHDLSLTISLVLQFGVSNPLIPKPATEHTPESVISTSSPQKLLPLLSILMFILVASSLRPQAAVLQGISHYRYVPYMLA